MAQDVSDIGESDKQSPKTIQESEGLSPRLTLLISVGTALLTSLLTPLFLERWTDLETATQQQREKRHKVIGTQFDIVEHSAAVPCFVRQLNGRLSISDLRPSP